MVGWTGRAEVDVARLEVELSRLEAGFGKSTKRLEVELGSSTVDPGSSTGRLAVEAGNSTGRLAVEPGTSPALDAGLSLELGSSPGTLNGLGISGRLTSPGKLNVDWLPGNASDSASLSDTPLSMGSARGDLARVGERAVRL